MPRNILLAYASRYGSTRETAEAIAAVLREAGHATTLKPMKRVRVVVGHDALVLGAPFYLGSWHGDARRFVERFGAELRALPVAAFALGPTMASAGSLAETCRGLEADLSSALGFTPLSARVFGGAYRPDQLGLFHRLLASLPASPLHGAPASDLRDGAAIRAWAADLAGRLA